MMPRLPHKTCPKASRHLLRGGGRSHKQSNWVNPSRPKKIQRESPPTLFPLPLSVWTQEKKSGEEGDQTTPGGTAEGGGRRRIGGGGGGGGSGLASAEGWGGVFAGVPSFLPRFAPGDERRKTQPAPPSSPILSRQL